ncbi:hypothetical protein D3C72_2081810 [compost metagenome]
MNGTIAVKDKKGEIDQAKLIGFIKVKIAQKEITSDGRKPRKLDALFGPARVDMTVYDNFVNQISNRKEAKPKPKDLHGQINQELQDEAGSTSVPSLPTE